jgi:hypothetical protein
VISRALAIAPSRYRDELHPILSRMASESREIHVASSALGQSGFQLLANAVLEIYISRGRCSAFRPRQSG